MTCAKMAVLMEMRFGILIRVGRRIVVLDEVHTWRIQLSRPCALAMWPYCQISWITC